MAACIGFDTGPGNCLLDAWARAHLGKSHDAGGAWAASGRIDVPLLDRLLAEPYFARQPPKSTGRETFSDAWLHLALAGRSLPAADVQASLCRTHRIDHCRGDPAGRCCAAASSLRLRRGRLQSRPAAAAGPGAAGHRGSHDGGCEALPRSMSRRPALPGWHIAICRASPAIFPP